MGNSQREVIKIYYDYTPYTLFYSTAFIAWRGCYKPFQTIVDQYLSYIKNIDSFTLQN